MQHYLRYWHCHLGIRRLRSELEWASASVGMWLVRRSGLMAITRTIRMIAHPTATTVRAGSRTGSLLEQVPGMAGDTHLTDATTVVALIATTVATSIGTLTADLRDGGLNDVAFVGM